MGYTTSIKNSNGDELRMAYYFYETELYKARILT